MMPQSEKAEAAATAADLAAQELPPAPEDGDQSTPAPDEPKPKRRRRAKPVVDRVDESRQGRICAGYFTTQRPDGVEVTFVPGEALPAWAPDDAPTR